MNADLGALSAAAVSIGFVHTLLGPDHYVPFVAMSRAGGWTRRKTLIVTVLCGLAHVGSSVLLGFIGLALGLIVFQLDSIEPQLEAIETHRGNIAGWLLIAFGIAYTAWGVVYAIRNRSHTHLHVHPDGTIHTHEHVHFDEHLHPHAVDAAGDPYVSPCASPPNRAVNALTPWILFAIFAFGPCEPLIPLLMYPAAKADMLSVACVGALFALTTIATMTTMVIVVGAGASALRFDKLTRYSHALAGAVVLSCGLAVKVGL
jgi:nickel/cobalt exporter